MIGNETQPRTKNAQITEFEQILAKDLKGWGKLIRPYQKADSKKAIWQMVTSILPFIGIWILMYMTYEISYTLTIALGILNAFFLVRIFIIQHDCGHHSFFKKNSWNNVVGFFCSLFSFIPYKYWANNHHFHHTHSGQLETRDIGDINTLTVVEYNQLSKFGRIKYRMFRHPLVMFVIGPMYYIFVTNKWPFVDVEGKNAAWKQVTVSNLAMLVTYFGLAYWIGLKSFLAVQLPITISFGVIAIWFFYVQHQHEHAYKHWKDNWDFLTAALKGSSFYKLPKLMHWLTGNIGYHHLHHLSSSIPSYNLAKCAKENPIFQKHVTQMTFVESLKCLHHKLWDEASQRMITFREYYQMEKLGTI